MTGNMGREVVVDETEEDDEQQEWIVETANSWYKTVVDPGVEPRRRPTTASTVAPTSEPRRRPTSRASLSHDPSRRPPAPCYTLATNREKDRKID